LNIDYKIKLIDDSFYILYIVNRKQETFEVLVDKEDIEKVRGYKYTWTAAYHKSIDGYYIKATEYIGLVDGRPKYKPVLLHRFIMNAQDNEHIDHKDNNTLDNRKANLRRTINEDNNKNRKARNTNNKTGYRNVCYTNGRYIVQLQINGKNKALGSFDDVDEAGRFAEEMRKKYYGDFAGRN
jgi:hypothetical protein